MQLTFWSYPFLFLTGLAAGLVDSIAGGGGIISLPVLLNLGLPVPVALGTNKLQSSFGSLTAAWHYSRQGVVDWRQCRVGVIATLAGAIAGFAAVQLVRTRFLEALIPWLLAAIVIYSIVRPQVGSQDHPPRMGRHTFFICFGLGLGFYDGFFGPGTGSFWTIALVAVMGFNFLKATAYTKIMNATSNVGSLVPFIAAGQVDFAAGLVMGAGQIAGARIGASLAVKRGARFVRPVFLAMVVAVMARLIWIRFTQ
ncbi:membrane protein [Opitutaceae bacterium TAV5]|nr:membrane protein [Opitutaceae bacterium TAV5]